MDFYSCIWIGQYNEINNLLRIYNYEGAKALDFESCREDYLKLRSIAIPKLAGRNIYCSLGIWNEDTNCMAKSAYDMQEIIRYTQAWYLHPEGGLGVNFNIPILEGDLPEIQCECHGEKEGCILTISGEESNFQLILKSLEVYISLFEYKIESLFHYYTNNAEALQLAKNIEKVYMSQDGVRTEKVQMYLNEIEKVKEKVEYVEE